MPLPLCSNHCLRCLECKKPILDGAYVQKDDPWFVMHKLCGPPVPKLGPFGDAATFQTDPMTVEYERQEAESAKLDAEIEAERRRKKKKR